MSNISQIELPIGGGSTTYNIADRTSIAEFWSDYLNYSTEEKRDTRVICNSTGFHPAVVGSHTSRHMITDVYIGKMSNTTKQESDYGDYYVGNFSKSYTLYDSNIGFAIDLAYYSKNINNDGSLLIIGFDNFLFNDFIKITIGADRPITDIFWLESLIQYSKIMNNDLIRYIPLNPYDVTSSSTFYRYPYQIQESNNQTVDYDYIVEILYNPYLNNNRDYADTMEVSSLALQINKMQQNTYFNIKVESF